MSILVKKKICKIGTSKAKGFIGCGSIDYLNWGLCPECKKKFLTTTNEGQELIIKYTLKAKKQINCERKEQLKEELKTISDYKKILQTEINKLVRIIDYGCKCIATGLNGKMSAGHFHSVGSNETLRYNLHNIHRQSFHSNSARAGDHVRYSNGLINEYGKDYYNYVMFDLQTIDIIKLKIYEIKEATKIVRKIIKEMPESAVYTKAERIELRTKYNLEIGIYS